MHLLPIMSCVYLRNQSVWSKLYFLIFSSIVAYIQNVSVSFQFHFLGHDMLTMIGWLIKVSWKCQRSFRPSGGGINQFLNWICLFRPYSNQTLLVMMLSKFLRMKVSTSYLYLGKTGMSINNKYLYDLWVVSFSTIEYISI